MLLFLKRKNFALLLKLNWTALEMKLFRGINLECENISLVRIGNRNLRVCIGWGNRSHGEKHLAFFRSRAGSAH